MSLRSTQTSKNAGYTRMIVDNGPKKQVSRKPGATSRLTLLDPSRKPKDHQGSRRLKDMQQMCKPHKLMRRFSPRCSRTTPWRWISCNGDSSRQNLGHAVDEDDLGYIKPSRYPNRKTCNVAVQERLSEKIGTSFSPSRAHPSGVQKSDTIRS